MSPPISDPQPQASALSATGARLPVSVQLHAAPGASEGRRADVYSKIQFRYRLPLTCSVSLTGTW